MSVPLLPPIGAITLTQKPLAEGSVNPRFERCKVKLQGLSEASQKWFAELRDKLTQEYGSDVEVLTDGALSVSIDTYTLRVFNSEKKRMLSFDLSDLGGSTVVPFLLVTGVVDGKACVKMTHVLVLQVGGDCVFD